jgi:hypothetical protein
VSAEPVSDSPSEWVRVARAKWAHYEHLCAVYEQGGDLAKIPVALAEGGLARMVPHLADAVDGLYADLRAANSRTIALGRQLVEVAQRNAPAACTCPGGLPDGWRSDFDPDCLRHGTPEATDDEIRTVASAAGRWCASRGSAR